MRKYLRQNNAITIIALVITIIVLFILASVTFVSITGNNGLLEKAKDATEAYDNAAKQEEEIINNSDVFFDDTYGFVKETDLSGNYDVKMRGMKLDLTSPSLLWLKFYFTMPEEKIQSGKEKIKFTTEVRDGIVDEININSNTVGTETINGENYYYVIEKLTLPYATANIKVCAYNENTQDSNEYNYTFKQYADKVLNQKMLIKTEKNKAMDNFIKASLELATFLQIANNINADNLANDGLDPNDTYDSYVTKESLELYEGKINTTDSSISRITTALRFDPNEIIINIFLTPNDSEELKNVELFVNGISAPSSQQELLSDGRLRISLTGSNLGKLDNIYNVEVKKGNKIYLNADYSAYSYRIYRLE